MSQVASFRGTKLAVLYTFGSFPMITFTGGLGFQYDMRSAVLFKGCKQVGSYNLEEIYRSDLIV